MEYKILNSDIHNADLSKLSDDERLILCDELRNKILDVVSKNGGHLASNLGVVELTVALLSVFDYKKDQLVFDVGHQAYAYKLLTGRYDRFDTLRTKDGISGFPRIAESEYDYFDTGHSATAISAALGYARANKIDQSDKTVIAIIGDGAMTGGPAYEAMNDLAHSKEKMIVILNDNEMSINKNVGGLSNHMSKIRMSSKYLDAKHNTENFLTKKMPTFGKPIITFMLAIKDFFRFVLYRKKPTIFENIGLVYYGPIDGHDVKQMIDTLNAVKKVNAPVLLHVCTKKGMGYRYAETNPSDYHGVSPFDLSTGVAKKSPDVIKSFTDYFSKKIVEIGSANKDVVAICAAMSSGTGLDDFANKFEDRFFDCGIAEEHCVTLAGGMALAGKVPVVAIYSTFLQRAYDQILEDVCFMNNHVVFCLDRAGFVGADGHTHNGLFDISYMLSMPQLTCFVPTDYEDFGLCLDYSVNTLKGPASIRYSKSSEYRMEIDHDIHKPRMISNLGNDYAIITCGTIQREVDKVVLNLSNKGLKGKCINICQIKPCPTDEVLDLIKDCKIVFTVEEGILHGGFGSMIRNELIDKKFYSPIHTFGIKDSNVHCGTIDEQLKATGLDADALTTSFLNLIN